MKARKVWPGMTVRWKVRGRELTCVVMGMQRQPRGRIFLSGQTTITDQDGTWRGVFLRRRQRVRVLRRDF